MKQFDLRRIVPVIIFGLILGSLFANIYCSDDVCEMGVFNFDFMEKMSSIKLDFGELFTYVVKERAKAWLLIFLFSFSSFYLIMYYLYLMGFGFLLGLTCSTMVMLYGFNGTLYFFLLCLVSQLFYLAAALIGISSSALYVRRKTKGRNVVFSTFFAVVLLIFGAFCETLFTMLFVKNFYKL